MNKGKKIDELISEMKSFEKETYHKSEILPELLGLQREMVELTFGKETEGLDDLRIWDVNRKLGEVNKNKNGIATEELEKFKKGSKKISYAISAEISGNRGEYYVFSKLERLQCRNIVIKNLELSDGNAKTELDAVVVTTKGVYIIEVKNSKKDIFISDCGNYYRTGKYNSFDCNIANKMRFREELVRNTLSAAGVERLNIRSIVVFTNNRISVTNENKSIKTCYLDQLLYNICNMDRDAICGDEELKNIGKCLEEARCKERYPFDFDISEIKRDFASLIVKLEDTPETERKEVSRAKTTRAEMSEATQRRKEVERSRRKRQATRKNIKAVAGVAIGILIVGSGLLHLGDTWNKSA